MTNLKNISDNELFTRCKKFGKEALCARQIFGGLLPEVCKRRLYEKKGYISIYEFAAKLGGLSHDQVDTVIRLERKFADKPALHTALVEGKICANKLIRIASIATTDNQAELFDAAQKLSKTAIDVYVKDYKQERAGGQELSRVAGRTGGTFPTGCLGDENKKQNGLFPIENAPKSLPVQTSTNIDFEIIAALTPELKGKIKSLIDKGINVSELFMDLLDQRENNIQREKDEIAHELEEKYEGRIQASRLGPRTTDATDTTHAVSTPHPTIVHPHPKPPTRHIPVKVKRIISQEFGTKCANPNCNNLAENLHHRKQFAVFKTHDPHFIEPLCKGHHELEPIVDNQYRRFK
jgi:hypothetical protein